jgi:ketosteroid isomerase-like protein
MTEDEARHFAEAWLAAWNSRDVDAIVAHYADDAIITSPLVLRRLGRDDGTLRGRDELREYVSIGLRSVPDLYFTLHHVLTGVDGLAVVYARENGALVADVMVLDDAGKVRRARAYYHGLPELPFD